MINQTIWNVYTISILGEVEELQFGLYKKSIFPNFEIFEIFSDFLKNRDLDSGYTISILGEVEELQFGLYKKSIFS